MSVEAGVKSVGSGVKEMENGVKGAENGASVTGRPRSLSSEVVGGFKRPKKVTYVSLTSHPGLVGVQPLPIDWGNMDPVKRGPICCTNTDETVRNAIGAHGGSYSIYRALAIASGALDPEYIPNYRNTEPAARIGPNQQWGDPKKIVTFDPFGALVQSIFTKDEKRKYDLRPTIAITKAHIELPEIRERMQKMVDGKNVGGKGLLADGKILMEDGQVNVTKAAIEPVWYLPGVAERFGCSEADLRELLFRETNGMYPELMTRTDLKIFLPPIGGMTVYIFGNPDFLNDETKRKAVRVHDECNGSDVFGSDICTCRPYLIHGIEVAIEMAQQGGVGVVVYFRKEGRALGEVTKYLVYNARKRQEGGDTAAEYFNCTQHVAGVQDSRFQALMPDCLHWLGITKIDRLVSMSNMKYEAFVNSGIKIVERVPIPKEMVPKDAQVEIDAKVYAGYEGGKVHVVTAEELKLAKGRPAELLDVNK